jgi:hypothetical protein
MYLHLFIVEMLLKTPNKLSKQLKHKQYNLQLFMSVVTSFMLLNY